MNPHIHYACMTCGDTGPREKSYKPSRYCGEYTDDCPNCGSQDVEVYDARYTRPGQDSGPPVEEMS